MTKSFLLFALIFLTVLVLAACEETPADPTDPPGATVKKGIAPQPDSEVAVIENENPAFGKIVIELYPNLAPQMVERFKTFSKQGFYNGVAWHRVDRNGGVIQTGDPNSKNDNPLDDGMGDSPLPNIPAEFSDVLFERGILGAARKGTGPTQSEQEAYNTANCQFFITLKRVNPWDKKYTVFGKVLQGMNFADIIAGAPPNPANPSSPAEKITIKSITLEPRTNYAK